ncbi:MAG: hypothetical protein ABL904_00140 [Hyphomicrobiaceae bacterium]
MPISPIALQSPAICSIGIYLPVCLCKHAYSADHARIMKTVPGSGGSTLTTRYLGPDAEIANCPRVITKG